MTSRRLANELGVLMALAEHGFFPPEAANDFLVLDNAATHKTKLVHDWLVKRPRFHLHFTPTSASWLNLVEVFFGIITRQAIRAFSIPYGCDAYQAIRIGALPKWPISA